MPTGDALIIGAGPAGINAAYALERAGIEYRIIERTAQIAPTWNSLYPSLRLNTSRFFSQLPGRRFPLRWGIHPTAKQYYRYLVDWAAEQRFSIEHGIEVYRVAPRGDGVWQVETNQGIETYRAVIPATGVFDNPQLPDIEGMDCFGGEIMHSRGFRDPDQVRGKRVMVVGTGPSGADIAVEAGKAAADGFAWLAIRSGIDLRPRNPYGLTRHVWMMIGERLPEPICVWLQKETGKLKYDLGEFSVWQRPPNTGSGVGYRGPELLNAMRRRQVRPVPHPIRFDARGATLADGQYIELDAVVMATGFLPVLQQYMDIEMQYSSASYYPEAGCDWDIGPNGVRGWPLRDISQHPNGRQVLGHEGLYLVGVFYKGRGAFYNMTVEAGIAAEQIRQYLAQRRFVPAAA